jgi:hypothetical protein
MLGGGEAELMPRRGLGEARRCRVVAEAMPSRGRGESEVGQRRVGAETKLWGG